MASLGHIAVGMAAARIYRGEPGVQRVSWTAMLLWAALSFLPDADVIGFGLGVRYEDPWGHRGATHSLMFALALGTTTLPCPAYGNAAVTIDKLVTAVDRALNGCDQPDD